MDDIVVTLAVAFATVFVAELGDKSQLLTLALATRLRPVTVQHTDRDPGRKDVEDAHVEAEALELRRHEREREEAEDDRRDSGERLQRRLQDVASARARVLAHVDRGPEPAREADEAGPERDDESSHEEGLDTEGSGLEERRPPIT